jgi:N-acetylmuramoyl-L-alanine amidase/FlgD Ig-like domain
LYVLRRLVPIAALAALLVPAAAHAGDVAMRMQEVPLGGRALAAAQPSMHFNMLAVHWIGGGAVDVRTHRLHGHWAAWQAADADNSTGAWHDGNVNWTGASDDYAFRVHGDVRRLRVYELWSRVTTKPSRALSQAGSPVIVSRAGWDANEEIVRAKPQVAPVLKLAVVHHTAGTNAYTRAQAPAIVRGIEVYHVRGNGWNDIGYNFLVDRFGTVYEGRGGGETKNVIGAHALGFNSGTVGVALVGNFTSAKPPKAMQDALVSLLAWRLDVAHVDPLSTVVYTSGGNYKFRAGKLVTLRAISGHRDTGPSECPGNAAYALLPGIAKQVSSTGLPKLYSPSVAGVLGGSVRFQARLSSALPWTVTIADQQGQKVASGKGTGADVSWTWNSVAATGGRYTWTIAATGVRAATGSMGISRPGVPPSVTNLVVAPPVISDDNATVTFTLGTQSQVVAKLYDGDGTEVLTVAQGQMAAGNNTFAWTAAGLPDGRYVLSLTATSARRSVTKSAPVVVDRTLTALTASYAAISPNGDGVQDSTTFSFNLAAQAPVQVDILQPGATIVATPFQGVLPAGPYTLGWDGTANGVVLPDGRYTALFTVTDALGPVQIPIAITIDTHAPTLAIKDAHTLAFTLDEPATVTTVINGSSQVVLAEPNGTFLVPFTGAVTSFTARAQDTAGNLSQPVQSP